MHTTLIELIRDPSLIPHVYDYCDQWCGHCRIAPRCLLYRTSGLRNRSAAARDAETLIAEGLAWARAVADAAGTDVARLDAQLCDPTFEPPPGVLGDRLERLGRHYMILANTYLQSIGIPDGPLSINSETTPMNVVAWLHTAIASKTFRALVSAHVAARGDPSMADDANATAKLVLTSIDRSREAFEEVDKLDPSDPRPANFADYLGMFATALEKRFPAARTFVRVGLDDGN